MDSHYQPIYKQAAALQHNFHDYTHTSAYDPTAKVLRNEIHHLTNDLAAGKNPRTIENRLRTINTQLKRSQMANPAAMPGQAPIMNANQTNMLRKNFETIRMGVRQHPHY
jgi:hypothetical protein